MARARLGMALAMVLVLLQGAVALAVPATPRAIAPESGQLADWPVSSGLLIAEVVTGGASGSDEYVELTNAGAEAVDLDGLEVAYVTSSGATVTRKAAWTSPLPLEPGRHLLLANVLGTYASLADATYSGGLSATGGALVLRPVGGAPLDAVAWGDATNGFVEGSAAVAPAAGTSIERRPGGLGGNTIDTNDNAADFFVNTVPEARNLASDPLPTPQPSSSPSPSASTAPTLTPSATPTPIATASPTPTPMPVATPSPTPTPTATPTPTPVATPTPSPSPSPTPTPTPTPSPSPSPEILPIVDVRGLPDGTIVTIEGILTTRLGALEGGRTGFVQDATGGIALYLDAAFDTPLSEGSIVVATGAVGSRYAMRTLRVDRAAVTPMGSADLPAPMSAATGLAIEPLEGLRLELGGIVTEAPAALSDGIGLTIDDGSGPVRVIVTPDALGAATPGVGSTIHAQGPLGQRDSSGTGTGGYRLYATLPGELEVGAAPTPTPSTAPTPTPTPSPKATPSPTAGPVPIAAARQAGVGSGVLVRGVVVAEAGRLGTPPLLSIADDTGGIPVRVPDGVPVPVRGTLVEVRGPIADPYGQTEIRPRADGFTVVGTAPLPQPLAIAAADAGEGTEGRLVTVHGTISAGATRSTSNDLAFTILGDDGHTLAMRADASAGLERERLVKGVVATFTGVLGQRASRKGALDGYRVWLRDLADIAGATSPVQGGGNPSPGVSAPPVTTIAAARVMEDGSVTVEGVLTIERMLLDATGRRTIVQDATGAIEVYLPGAEQPLRAGDRVRITGTVGRAWGAPRLRAAEVQRLGTGQPVVHPLRGTPSAATEWSLVRVSGTIVDLHRTGDRWLAELQVGTSRIPIQGLAGSGIPAASVLEGRAATVIGIVKRPYPTAADRRFSIVPRTPTDLVVSPSARSGGRPGTSAGDQAGQTGMLAPGGAATPPSAPDVDLRDLGVHVGEQVRVGGLVADIRVDGIVLDDGTAIGRLVLDGAAGEVVPLLQPGDALTATGVPEARGEVVLVVSDPASVELAGDPVGEALAPGPPGAATPDDRAATESDQPGALGGDASAMASFRGDARPDQPWLVIAMLLSLTALPLLLARLRERRAQRLSEVRIAGRLASLTASTGGEGVTPRTAPGPLPACGRDEVAASVGGEIGDRG